MLWTSFSCQWLHMRKYKGIFFEYRGGEEEQRSVGTTRIDTVRLGHGRGIFAGQQGLKSRENLVSP